MKLEYKILWIDNDDKIYQDHQELIEDHLINLGFTPIIEKGKDYESFDKFENTLDQFDLFILDYKLDGDKNGNEIIKDIREEIYTDVIFYSTLPEDVRQKIYDDKLSGVYYTGRDFEDFEDDVLGVIDVTIKKVQDVNNLRGLIMAEVAELDRIKERILINYSTQEKQRTIETYILEKLEKSYNDNLKKRKKFLENPLHEIIDNLYVDSDKKARAVKKVDDTFNESKYRTLILNVRNKFAHIEETVSDGNKMIGDIPFTEAECIKIRKDIKEYKNILVGIENQYSVPKL